MNMTTVNCETGEIEVRPLTEDEKAAVDVSSQQIQADLEKADEQRKSDIDTFLASLPEGSRAAAKRLLSL